MAVGPPPTTEPYYRSDFEKKVLELVNKERSKAGLKPLQANQDLNSAARIRAKELVTSSLADYYSHTRPDGRPFSTAVTIPNLGLAENAYKGPDTPEEAMAGWMYSEGHRNNILDPELTHLGVGCWHDANEPHAHNWIQIFALIPSSDQYHKNAYDDELVRLINQARAKQGQEPYIVTDSTHEHAKQLAVHYSRHENFPDNPGYSRLSQTVIIGTAGAHAYDTPQKVFDFLYGWNKDFIYGDSTHAGIGYYHNWSGKGVHWWGVLVGNPRD